MKKLSSVGMAFCPKCLLLYPLTPHPSGVNAYDPKGVVSVFKISNHHFWARLSEEDLKQIETALVKAPIEEAINELTNLIGGNYEITKKYSEDVLRKVILKNGEGQITSHVVFSLAMDGNTPSVFYLITEELLTSRKFVSNLNEFYRDRE